MPKIFGKFLVIFTITAMPASTILSISTTNYGLSGSCRLLL